MKTDKLTFLEPDSLLSDELFGPLLPVVKADYKKACEITRRCVSAIFAILAFSGTNVLKISSLEHPLGLYIFSNEQKEIDYGKASSPSQPACISSFPLITYF